MNVDNVTVFLNKEDGSQLAMFVQERFVLDIKVRYFGRGHLGVFNFL